MILSTLVAGMLLATPQAAGPGGRGYVSGKYAIQLDGIRAGWVHSVDGGHATAEVITDTQPSSDGIIHKHIAGVKYEDVTITAGSGMSPDFYGWIKDSFDHKYSRKNGQFTAADFNYKERGRMAFQNGLISEVGFPALDAASKDAAKMSLKFKPEITRFSSIQPPVQTKGPSANAWQASNFTVVMPDFPNVTVLSVDRVKVQFHWDRVGKQEVLDCDDFVITIPESEAKPFQAWYDDFVVKGNNGPKFTKTAVVQYFNPDTTIALSLQGLGAMSVNPVLDPLFRQTKVVKVEMYCEDLKCEFSGSIF